MKTLNFFSKIVGFIALVSCSVWLGAYITRLFIYYNIFDGPELLIRGYLSEVNLNIVLFSSLPATVTSFVSYLIFIIAFLIFLFASGLNLKYNGWLFIILVVVLITLPFEGYLMILDYKMISLFMAGNYNSDLILSLVKNRITELSSFPVIIIISYISFYYFLIFQPLTKVKEA